MRNVLSGISFTEEGALKASSPLPTVFSLGIWPETEKKKKNAKIQRIKFTHCSLRFKVTKIYIFPRVNFQQMKFTHSLLRRGQLRLI